MMDPYRKRIEDIKDTLAAIAENGERTTGETQKLLRELQELESFYKKWRTP